MYEYNTYAINWPLAKDYYGSKAGILFDYNEVYRVRDGNSNKE